MMLSNFSRLMTAGVLLSGSLAVCAETNWLSKSAGGSVRNYSSQAAESGVGSAEALIDGSGSFAWSSGDNTWPPHTFTFDLAQTAAINRIVLDNSGVDEQGQAGSSTREFGVFILASEANGTDTLILHDAVQQGARSEFQLPQAVTAKSLRLEILSNYGNKEYTGLGEIEAWGDETSEVAASTGQSESGPSETETGGDDEGCQGSDCDRPEDNDRGRENYWKGWIKVMQFGPILGNRGDLHTNWNLQVSWREKARIDVKDNEDVLVGQFVLLEDDNSGWSAERLGTVYNDGACRYSWTDYEATGVGSRTLNHAWIYFSFDEQEDPLVEVLPNGVYYATHPTREHVVGIANFHSRDCKGGDYNTTSTDKGMPLAYHLGRHLVHPMDSGQSHIPAEAFRDEIHRAEQYREMGIRVMDTEQRFVKDGVMQGRYESAGAGSALYWQVSWNIERVLDVDATLKAVKRNWRPEHDNEANTLSVTANVEQLGIPGKFHFTLFDVTREKGWAMNAGKKNDDSLDLEFVDGLADFLSPKETSDGWTIEANRTMSTATVVIKANDYGAWGKLKCKVNVDGEWWPCKSDDGKEYVTIPHDEDENKIADFWEERKGVSGDAAADDDETPEGREPGDGFSNYEEYRGFQIEGSWRDTDPTEKDLFVHNASGLAEIESAINEFENETKLTVHKINKDELDRKNRIINFNRGIKQAVTRNGKGQAGVIVVIRGLDDDVCGEARPDPRASAFLGGPNVTQLVVIDPSCTHGSTAIHELGHAVNLWHPGGRYLFEECGPRLAAGMGTPYAGPMNNFMRYRYAGKYIGPDDRCYEYPSHLEVARSAFVTSPGGTGMNAPPADRWWYNTLDGVSYPYPVSGDATCPGTLIDKSMSLNQDSQPRPAGC